MALPSSSLKRNPESFLELKKVESYPEPSISSYSEASQFRCKRINSMNIERNDFHENKHDYMGYSRRMGSDFNPL